MLVARDVHVRYASAVALAGADIEVAEGEWCAVMGPSGAGKSTLLNVVGGLERPTAGQVLFAGADVLAMDEAELARFRRENVGFVFQRAHLVAYLDAVENVMLAQYFHSATDEEEAVEALRQVGLENRLRHLPGELSAGEQQRVGIARALINRPRLLLADEPTGNLDRESTGRILGLLRERYVHQRFALVLVTHDPEVAGVADRVLAMVDGRVERGNR